MQCNACVYGEQAQNLSHASESSTARVVCERREATTNTRQRTAAHREYEQIWDPQQQMPQSSRRCKVGASVAPVCASRKRRHYSGIRHYSTADCSESRTISLLNRHYRGVITAVDVPIIFSSTRCHDETLRQRFSIPYVPCV